MPSTDLRSKVLVSINNLICSIMQNLPAVVTAQWAYGNSVFITVVNVLPG